MKPKDFFTSWQTDRVMEHREMKPLHSRNGSYMADVEQYVSFTSPGPFVPTLTKHAKVVSIGDDDDSDVMMVALEHLAERNQTAHLAVFTDVVVLQTVTTRQRQWCQSTKRQALPAAADKQGREQLGNSWQRTRER